MATVQDYLKNAKWVKRMNECFDQLDVNKSGYLSREDWLIHVNNLAKVVTDRPALIAKAREVTLEYTDALGLTEGVKADKQKFLELAAAMSIVEIAKVKKGEKSLIEIFDNALFDVVDRNHDGCLTFDEFKVMMKAGNFDDDVAPAIFALLDKNKNGKIERSEYIAADIKFWCNLDDPDTQGMFGEKYE